MDHRIVLGDNLDVLPDFEDDSFDLIYIDPPFNTGREQRHTRVAVERDETAARVGFGGHRYRAKTLSSLAFKDSFDDFLAFVEPRLQEAHRLLRPTGSFFLHIDPRESHYCKVLLDAIFGRDRFVNEIVWAYDFGGRPKRKWPSKHDVILWYVKDPNRYTFNYDAIDRIPYMAPNLVGAEKAARGKTPTDVWWQTIVPTSGSERTGYPTQKPRKILDRIVAVHSNPGDRLLDFFAGSGTLGEAAARCDRAFTLVDSNLEAIEIMGRRLAFARPRMLQWRDHALVPLDLGSGSADDTERPDPASTECVPRTDAGSADVAPEQPHPAAYDDPAPPKTLPSPPPAGE